jgi:hypothetical protein
VVTKARSRVGLNSLSYLLSINLLLQDSNVESGIVAIVFNTIILQSATQADTSYHILSLGAARAEILQPWR